MKSVDESQEQMAAESARNADAAVRSAEAAERCAAACERQADSWQVIAGAVLELVAMAKQIVQ